MRKGVLKLIDSLGAFIVLGPGLAMLARTLRAPDGDPWTTPLTSSNPALGAGILVFAVLAALVVAVFSGRLIGRGRGVWIAGVTLFWFACATGNVRQVLGDRDGPAALTGLILESALLIPLSVALAILVETLSPITGEDQGHPHHATIPALGLGAARSLFAPKSFVPSLAASIIAAGLVGWLAAITPYKGQAIFAAFLAGIAAGFAPGFAAPGQERERPPSLVPAIAALPIVALLSFLWVKYGVSSLTAQVNAIGADSAGGLFALGRILPLDWMAGGLAGVPVGAGWAVSMLEHKAHHPSDDHPQGARVA